ncbi:MAG: hypothetical protein Q4D77_01980 [Peptostreptococcaceae bacterium]|nr:hypothetical protein [Peptostreptococcaceae bacterium]
MNRTDLKEVVPLLSGGSEYFRTVMDLPNTTIFENLIGLSLQ